MIFELSVDGKPWATAVPLTHVPADAAAGAMAAASASASASATSATPAAADPLLKIKLMLLAKVGMTGSGFMIKLPLQDRPEGFEAAGGNRFTAAKEAKDAAEAAAAAATGEAADPEAAARALSVAQEAKQTARANFRALLHFLRVACLSTKEAASLALKHKPDGFGQKQFSSHAPVRDVGLAHRHGRGGLITTPRRESTCPGPASDEHGRAGVRSRSSCSPSRRVPRRRTTILAGCAISRPAR